MEKMTTRIERKLQAALSPVSLEVLDESHKHAGHVGNPDGTAESHFHVNISAGAFDGLNRLARQRLVMTALKEEMAGPIHALSMTCKDTNDR